MWVCRWNQLWKCRLRLIELVCCLNLSWQFVQKIWPNELTFIRGIESCMPCEPAKKELSALRTLPEGICTSM